jgi:hypothetical protein
MIRGLLHGIAHLLGTNRGVIVVRTNGGRYRAVFRCSTCGRTRAARASDGGAWLSTGGEPGTRVSLVLPVETAALHDAMNRACWCRPEVTQPCAICTGGWVNQSDDGLCRFCDGTGWVGAYSADPSMPTIITHNDPLA